jgi:predicted RNase H-like nuclease (RuvC/YqgF family)
MNPTSPDQASSSPPAQQPQTRLAAFTSFLPYGRRVTNGSTDATSPSSPPRPRTSAADAGLQEALNREQALRKAAESRLTQANSELEDLTAQLFSQANEMVAQERKARMKLEERVEMLERRDNEKRKRLERLEKAIERVARVRGMVDTR